jgi:outer membrane lipoprotein-sorting protein
VQGKILEAYQKVTHATAQVELTRDELFGDTHITNHMKGTYAYRREGEKRLMRQEMDWEAKIESPKQNAQAKFHQVLLINGDEQYLIDTRNGQTRAQKTLVSPDIPHDPNRMFDGWRKGFAVSVNPEAEVDGHKTYVLQIVPLPIMLGLQERTLFYFRQDCGVLVKRVQYNEDGMLTWTTNYTDVKLDADLPLDQFRYSYGPEVPLVDRTQPPTSSQPTSGPATSRPGVPPVGPPGPPPPPSTRPASPPTSRPSTPGT